MCLCASASSRESWESDYPYHSSPPPPGRNKNNVEGHHTSRKSSNVYKFVKPGTSQCENLWPCAYLTLSSRRGRLSGDLKTIFTRESKSSCSRLAWIDPAYLLFLSPCPEVFLGFMFVSAGPRMHEAGGLALATVR